MSDQIQLSGRPCAGSWLDKTMLVCVNWPDKTRGDGQLHLRFIKVLGPRRDFRTRKSRNPGVSHRGDAGRLRASESIQIEGVQDEFADLQISHGRARERCRAARTRSPGPDRRRSNVRGNRRRGNRGGTRHGLPRLAAERHECKARIRGFFRFRVRRGHRQVSRSQHRRIAQSHPGRPAHARGDGRRVEHRHPRPQHEFHEDHHQWGAGGCRLDGPCR